MYAEDKLLPISALQHILFCERRAALVHIERVWIENIFTAEGRNLHKKADDPGVETRGTIRIVRGLQIQSLRLGLVGKMDVVEFHKVATEGIRLSGIDGLWNPHPVEYKRGELREEKGYMIQLCAQALCLEEMLKVKVVEGYIFYGKSRRRLAVEFSDKLRLATEMAASKLHSLIDKEVTPKAQYSKKCENCSLMNVCMPRITEGKKSVGKYMDRLLADIGEEP